MTDNKSKKNKNYKKKAVAGRSKTSKKYRKIKLYYNIIFAVIIVFMVIYGALHVFTKKKAFRNDGLKYYEKGEYEAAIESFNKALSINQWFSESVDVDIEMYKADSYIKLSDFAAAGRVYSSIKSKYPEKYYDADEIDFLIELTGALDKYKYGDYTTTVACFNRAVEAGYTEMSIYVANCYEQNGDYEKMKSNLDIYTGSFGYTPDICYKYAAYYIVMNDYSSALICIEQGLSYGENAYTQEFLYAQILCYANTDNYEKAFELASSYKDTYPDDTKGADIYAWLDTRVNPDTEVINDIFDQNDNQDDSTDDNEDTDNSDINQ